MDRSAMFNLPEVSAVRLNVRMSIEEQRKAYDRRQRAWVYLVLGFFATAPGWTGIGSERLMWNVVGFALLLGGIAAMAFGIALFRRPRP